MQFHKYLLILFLSLLSCEYVKAQEKWKTKMGPWINIKLDEAFKSNLPFDSTAFIFPRFLWLNNLKEFEIELRFEQMRTYRIIKITNERISYKNGHLFLKGDTLLCSYYGETFKFIKYKKY